MVGGLCWSLDGGERFPTMYELTEGAGGAKLAFRRYTEWPEDACMRVTATGAACLLIHRTALEKVAKAADDPAAPWFRESAVGAPLSLMGEDMTFCLRCAAAGMSCPPCAATCSPLSRAARWSPSGSSGSGSAAW